MPKLLVQACPLGGLGGGELIDDRADPPDQVTDLRGGELCRVVVLAEFL
jgi:hypothetical protein